LAEPLWRPTRRQIEDANMTGLMRRIERDWAVSLPDYDALWRFSIDEMAKFWTSLWDDTGVIAETRGERAIVDGEKMPGARFFPDARLNFAENLLRRRDDGDAIVFRREDGLTRRYSARELYDAVSRLAQALRDVGLKPGDVCAGFVPNMPENVIAMLAASSLGAVWTSCSPDFGVAGVLDRFGQCAPKLLFTADGYVYGGKRHDSLGRVAEFVRELASVERVIVFPFLEDTPDLSGLANAETLGDFIAPYEPGEIAFERFPFDQPLYIMYSSGTTGVPKCILHGAGGSLLQHLKEHRYHFNIKPGGRVFFFTTCGWMMWNWLASVLASEAAIMLYDGSPFHPGPEALFDFAEAERITMFGTSSKFIDALAKVNFRPIESHDLSAMTMLAGTGSPMVPESYDYIYAAVKKDVHLASASGGTELLSCFVGGNPLKPLWRGEIQCAALGMAVDVFDEAGKSLRGTKGELVCTKPFPSMPLGFWNDPDGAKYFNAYFAKYPNVWCHGDFVAFTEHDGMIIFGRSDATLNPGGVRIGTAEIYRQVEQIDEVVESIVIGQEWGGDTRIVLFVRLGDGARLDDALREKIKKRIRENCTPRHVPAKIVAVADIPRTKSGKIVEIAVREVVHGRPVKNIEALANADALAFYRDLPELKEA
jgi:acetoacetyl-CoA synthetase